MLGLVLVTLDCGITTECSVNKSVNTTVAHIYAFCETKPLCINAIVWRLRTFSWHKQSQSASRRSDRSWIFFLIIFLSTPTTLDQTPSDYPGVVVVAVLIQNYVGITRSLATRRTRGTPKLLKCINKAQPKPEPWNNKTQLRGRSHACKNRELRSLGANTDSVMRYWMTNNFCAFVNNDTVAVVLQKCFVSFNVGQSQNRFSNSLLYG